MKSNLEMAPPIPWQRTASGVIEPLEDPDAHWPPCCFPPALETLFSTPTTAAYAVIDAAKVFGLPQLLEASGLEHRCLFLGNAEEEWGDVAPWLVRLEHDHPVTRQLFLDKTDPPALSFRKATSLLIGSDDGFEAVFGHLRRYTKVRAEDGRVLMLRFYDPVTFADLLEAMPADQIAQLLGALTVTCLHPDGTWFTAQATPC